MKLAVIASEPGPPLRALLDRLATELEVTELDPAPAAPGSSCKAIADALIASERALREDRPDAVLVSGSTPSTLAAALSAAKLELPLATLDAGVREPWSGPGSPPRGEAPYAPLADRLATLRLCHGADALEALRAEGLEEGTVEVGSSGGGPGPAARAIIAWLGRA